MGKRGPKSIIELASVRPLRSGIGANRSTTLTPPPDHLQAATKAWWVNVVRDHAELQPHQLHTLQAAAESWDRYQQARKAIAEHGLVFEDDRGTIKARPEVSIERDSRIAFVRCIRELDLKVGPPAAGGVRPSELYR